MEQRKHGGRGARESCQGNALGGMETPRMPRNEKDRIFRMLFKEKKELLELYNAVGGTDYRDEEKLEVVTLENAVYMGMKNDVSFVFGSYLNMYEHQSTVNENIPLRDLLYVSRIFSRMVWDKNLYGRRRIMLPEPVFVEFYNGTEEMPERSEKRLSQSYLGRPSDPALELRALVLNINAGKNKEIAGKCRALQGYMTLVGKIREYVKQYPRQEAVERAVRECIEEDILSDFLRKNRAEVVAVGIFEYDEERHMEMEREEAREEGREEGLEKGREEGIRAFIKLCREFCQTEQEILHKLLENFQVTDEDAGAYLGKYW